MHMAAGCLALNRMNFHAGWSHGIQMVSLVPVLLKRNGQLHLMP